MGHLRLAFCSSELHELFCSAHSSSAIGPLHSLDCGSPRSIHTWLVKEANFLSHYLPKHVISRNAYSNSAHSNFVQWTFSSSESFVLTRWTVPTLALQFQQHILFIIIFPSLPLFFLLNNVDAALTFIFCLSKYNQNWMLNSSEESWGLGHCRLQTCPFN